MKRYTLFIALLTIIQTASGQVNFTASAEKVVQTGETFRLVYSINANVSGFEAPKIKDFDILSGPNRSTSQSFEYINGKSTRSITNTFTYYLRGKKEGNFSIPPAKAVADGENYTSNSVEIKVVKGEKPAEPNNANNTATNPEDLFLRVIVNKTELYKGEALTATVKLYTRVDLVRIDDLSFPKFPGFFIKTIYTPDRINLERETYNGEIYNTAILRRDLVFPQKSGKLTIGKAEIDLIARIITGKGRNFFGQIVNHYENISRSVSSPPIVIDVKPLPDGMPDKFSGLTGSDFSVKTEIDRNQLKTDESTNLKITVSGKGNLHILDDINLPIPPEVESFPEKDNNVQFGAGGASGNIQFNYLLIPRSPGKYLIPAVNISYFDTKSKRYRTVNTEEIVLEVKKGADYDDNRSPHNSPETAEQINDDIRYLKQNNGNFRPADKYFAGSRLYYGSFLLALILFAAVIILRRKKIKERANVAHYNNRRAAKISRKQLRTAKKLLNTNSIDVFHKEIINALWSYTANKYNLPHAELTKEKIQTELSAKNVSEDDIKALIGVLNDAEYAQYGGTAKKENAEEIFRRASDIILKLERSKSSAGIKIGFLFIFSVLMLSAPTLKADTPHIDSLFAQANKHYAENNFREAEQLYTKILDSGFVAPELYYNLGNSCYRLQKYTEAIYYYEKAALYRPSDKDIQHNLDFAKLSVHKRIKEKPDLFFNRIYKKIINCCPADRWATISLSAFVAALGLMLFYLFSKRRRIRIISFLLSMTLLIATIFSFAFAESRHNIETGEYLAIVFTEAVPLRSSPNETATILIRISAGHKVEIQDYSGDWAEVKLSNGQVGWLPKSDMRTL